ncbi:MAG: hypothetical protein RMJ56_11975 [Gemmataceae bacterium]|nr:hypothetical protein [Gemmata sp.]MDW8198309.1 hypothetical protein [Gemmataceae bacterium]
MATPTENAYPQEQPLRPADDLHRQAIKLTENAHPQEQPLRLPRSG